MYIEKYSLVVPLHAICLWFSSYDEREYLHQSKLPTDHFQKSLLRLPIPKLEETCSRYLASQRPLLSEAEHKHTEAIVNEFRDGVGKC